MENNNQIEKMLNFIEGYKLDVQFTEDNIKAEYADLEYNKKQIAESTAIRDIEYYMEKIKTNLERIKDLELKKSIKLNFINTLEKIHGTK